MSEQCPYGRGECPGWWKCAESVAECIKPAKSAPMPREEKALIQKLYDNRGEPDKLNCILMREAPALLASRISEKTVRARDSRICKDPPREAKTVPMEMLSEMWNAGEFLVNAQKDEILKEIAQRCGYTVTEGKEEE